MIFLSINNLEITHIRDCTKSSEAWKKLAKIYEPKGFARKCYLCRKLTLLQMAKGDTIQQHISTLDDIMHQLTLIGVTILNDEIAMMLLDSLPESYENLVVMLENVDNITIDFVKT